MEAGDPRSRETYETYIKRLIDSYISERREYPFIRNPNREKGIRRRERHKEDVPWHPFWVGFFNLIPGLGIAIMGQKQRGLHYFGFWLLLIVTCIAASIALSILGFIFALTIILIPLAVVCWIAASLVLFIPLVDMGMTAADGGILASRIRRGYYVMPGEAAYGAVRLFGGQFIKPSFVFHSASPEVPEISSAVNKTARRLRELEVRLERQRQGYQGNTSAYLDEIERELDEGSPAPVDVQAVPSAALDAQPQQKVHPMAQSAEPPSEPVPAEPTPSGPA
ncbi:hypothetical protein J8273_3606 [Carpediemonas membranifera]|uniref:Uncharacterized protein n=1 Tax=Carpediemonas membranifera TaxID=201153 RepID=A0A8J6ASM5_9EUKA|nr:hypothetical protein J8273_3606 [Carpediemonas membranifera]|eukprot:KAG9393466.1 hypothetical protein J8273_3606 [Carpediemonas membranifera]